MTSIRSLIKKEIIPPHSKRVKLKDQSLKCCDQIIVSYKKQISSLDDIIKVYQSGVDIPKVRYVDSRFLNELKLLTATLMQEMVIYKEEIKKLLR